MALGSLLLISFYLVQNPYWLVMLIFFTSLFITFALPAISAAYVDYISKNRREEKEIEALTDFSGNSGYIVGPILAGVLADNFGNLETFSILGIFGLIAIAMLLKFTPKKMRM